MAAFKSKRPRKAPSLKEDPQPFFQQTGNSSTSFFSKTNGNPIQTKLTVGKPGDAFEREADAVADTVVNHSEQNHPQVAPAKAGIQRKPGDESINQPSVMRMQKEKEEVQTKPELQMQKEEEEEVQTKPELQMQKEEEEVQTKPELQMQKEEEEVQTKSEPGTTAASSAISSQLHQTKGHGHPLPVRTQAEMSSAFGTDFSDVQIHTDRNAVQMNRDLHAQAFTQGKDIYFNQDKFDPNTKPGKHLLAHELTHVVQQTGEA